jgi:hypothetical protein
MACSILAETVQRFSICNYWHASAFAYHKCFTSPLPQDTGAEGGVSPAFPKNVIDAFSADLRRWLPRPSLCSDRTLSNFHFCGSLKKRHFKGKHFWNIVEMIGAHWCVQTLSPYFISVGNKHVVCHWDKCLNLSGNYTEKQSVYPYCIYIKVINTSVTPSDDT